MMEVTLSNAGTSRNALVVRDGALHREFLLSQLRCASLRAKLAANELDSIGVALRGNLITSDCAVEWLSDVGLSDCIAHLPEVKQ